MTSFNRVFLIGNLTKDPELRYTGTGVPITNLRLAVNHRYKTQAGELKDDVCYINIVVIGKQAVPCNYYLKKGSSAFVEGRLQTRSWESDGQKKSVIEVFANRVQFMGKKPTDVSTSNIDDENIPDMENNPVMDEEG